MFFGRKIRLYPTKRQYIEFSRYAGAARFAWNESLNFCEIYSKQKREEREAIKTVIYNLEILNGTAPKTAMKIANTETRDYKTMPTETELETHLRELRNTTHSWLYDIPVSITARAIKDLMKAYQKAFKNQRENRIISKKTNKKTGQIINPYGFPQFKKKYHCNDSFYQRPDRFHTVDRRNLKITGIKKPVRCKYASHISEHIMNPRITLDNGYWYLSYSYEVKDTPTVSFDDIKLDDIIGIDLGIKSMAITSYGEVFDNPNHDETCKKLLNRIRFLQRRLNRKYEANKENKDENGHMIKTKNMIKLERKISRLWKRVRDYRQNARHQFTSAISNTKPKVVVVEDLNTKGMLSNKKLAHAIGQVGFYELQRQLVYKGKRDGFYVIQAPRFYPSTQVCSCCGKKTGPRGFDGLKVRSWECSNCHAVHDRDVNAARSLVLWLCNDTSGFVCWNISSGSLELTQSTFGESGDETQYLLEEMSIKEKVLSLTSKSA